MAKWSQAPCTRDQLVLFSERLDDAIPADHRVRLLDEILSRIDWSSWEAHYSFTGRDPIHPRVLAGTLLYGLLTRIRSSRMLEEALQVRMDFRWLAEGRSIDHTTLSEFRRTRSEALMDLFVQIGLIARQMGLIALEQLAFDGTRLRANNRKTGTRTPESLRKAKKELAEKFRDLETRMSAADSEDEEQLGLTSAHELPQELADTKRRIEKVDKALAELDRLASEQATIPSRLPITDPESRLTPNKEGGFAPNYTPLAMVDTRYGFIVSEDVIATTDEHKRLVGAIQDVQTRFGMDAPPNEVLADGLMPTGENLAELETLGIELYSPVVGDSDQDNPAEREDPTQPIPQEHWDELPTKTIKRDGTKYTQLDKSAFIFDPDREVYYCPQGKELPLVHTTRETGKGRKRIRHRHLADEADCKDCPLRTVCLSRKAKSRQINREQHEKLRVQHAKKMETQQAKDKYACRRHVGERPFAIIKQHMGARRFLLRGLGKVKTEWRWLATAFNLHRLLHLWGRAGPI